MTWESEECDILLNFDDFVVLSIVVYSSAINDIKTGRLPLISMNFGLESSTGKRVILTSFDDKLPNQAIEVKYSNIRLRMFDLTLSNPSQALWRFDQTRIEAPGGKYSILTLLLNGVETLFPEPVS